MNAPIINKIANYKKYPDDNFFESPETAMESLYVYLTRHFEPKPKITVAGKNFNGFDKLFLKKATKENTWMEWFHHRCLDPASMYVLPCDIALPSLQECLQRAGIEEVVTHTAVEDALQVSKLINYHFQQIDTE
jgi:hypothetical protein